MLALSTTKWNVFIADDINAHINTNRKMNVEERVRSTKSLTKIQFQRQTNNITNVSLA